MSNMKIISIMDAENKQQSQQVKADIEEAAELTRVRIQELAQDVRSLRTRVQDLTLRVTVLEGGVP
jgi:chaperonin cofactor prefoldin